MTPTASAFTSIMQQPRDRNKRAKSLPGATLGNLDDNLLITCASYLDADGLAQLGRASTRFGIPQSGRRRSLANKVARAGGFGGARLARLALKGAVRQNTATNLMSDCTERSSR